MDFQEADRRYIDIKRQHSNGDLSDEQFEEQLKEIMVKDAEGHWWSKGRKTGGWHYYDGSAWVPGIPPTEERPTVEEQPPVEERPQPPVEEQPPVQPPPAQGRSGLWIGGGIITALVGIIIVPFPLSWLVYFLGLYFGYSARQRGSTGGGVGVMVLNGTMAFIELLLYLTSGCTVLNCL